MVNGTSKNVGLEKILILAGSRNLEGIFDKSASLVFAWFVFTFWSLETFYQGVSGSDF